MVTPSYSTLLSKYKEALQAIAVGGQSYQIGPRTLTRANLKEVRETIQWLEGMVSSESDATGGLGLAAFGDPI